MRIRDLFTVQEGTKVTEKVFGKVLISSICCILLCMACLVGTTWAWFTVSVENEDNQIQIATIMSVVTVTDENGATIEKTQYGNYVLDKGAYTLHVQATTDATQQKPVFALVAVTEGNETKYYRFSYTFDESTTGGRTKAVYVNSNFAVVNVKFVWLAPDSAIPVDGDGSSIGEPPAAPVVVPTTEPATEPTEGATTEPTQETESTEPTEGATTEPTRETESTDPTETTGETGTTDPVT